MKKLAVAVLVTIAFTSMATAYTGNTGELSEWRIEAEIYNNINEERTQRGLEPLRYKPGFSYEARDHSESMADQNRMFHTDGILRSLDSDDCWSAAENVAYTYSFNKDEAEVADRLVDMWMNSPGHRYNILNEDYTYTGIGIEAGNSYQFYATQNFCG